MKSTRSPFTMDSVQDTSDSKPQHVPEPIAYPQLLKLVLAAVLLGASIVLVRVAFGPEVTWQHGPAYVMLRICGILITAGIVYCLWLQYCVSGERWILLATVAFTGLIAGQLIYTLSLMTAFDSDSGLRKIGYQWYATWSAAAHDVSY